MCGGSDTAHLSTPWTTPPLADTTGYRYGPRMDRNGIRVNLTLPEETIRVLDRMSAVTGAGRATIIRQWLEEAGPQLAEMATAMERATQGNVDAALRMLGRTLDTASSDAQQLSLNIKSDRRKAMRKRSK